TVFRAVLTSAIRICDADWGTIERINNEGLELALQVGGPTGFANSRRPNSTGADVDTLERRVLARKAPLQVVDVQKEFPQQTIPVDWYRTALLVPMVRDDRVIGAIGLYRYDEAVSTTIVSGTAAGDPGAVRDAAAQPKPQSQS